MCATLLFYSSDLTYYDLYSAQCFILGHGIGYGAIYFSFSDISEFMFRAIVDCIVIVDLACKDTADW